MGQPGTYTITVSNSGNGPTNGAVTVADTLPAGLAATAISGNGWTCTLGTVTCTRADSLALASSYPAISLVVNASGVAPTRVTNTVTVSGGGETNTVNDLATDLTNISAPDLTVGLAPGIFFQGAIGATYVIFPGNNGDLPTVGTVTVQDTVSAGLTPTAISGAGWNCTLANLTCTRADSVPAFTGYPVILVTVDVALNAPSTVTNVATISGGGESNTGNDTAQDVSGVGPPHVPDITVSISHAGNGFVQGQPGTYTVQVSNVGLGASSGTVSVTASLPPSLTPTSLGGPGWSCTLGTLTCTRSDVIGGGLFSNTITLNVNVAPDAPATVAANAVVSGGGDTNAANNTASDVTTIAPPVVDFVTQVFSTTNFFQGQTGGNVSVFITNIGNIPSSGLVTVVVNLQPAMTATSISGTGWSCTLNNLTCIRSDALGTGPAFPNIVLSVNVAANAPAQLTVSAVLTGSGDTNLANNTATINFPITPAVQLIGLGSATGTLSAGQSSAFNFQIVTTGSAGTVSFNCSGLPTGAACNFTPTTLPPISTITQVTLNITTTARSELVDTRPRLPGNRIFVLLILSLAALLMFVMLRGPRMKFKLAFGVAGIVLLLLLAGCGGGGGSPPPIIANPNGTPAGTYSITMTANGANAGTTTQVFTLVVK